MAATTPPTQSVARRPRFRLSTMEVLGFIETPGTAVNSTLTWVDTTTHAVAEPPALPKPALVAESDPFARWTPQELGSRFTRGRIRWGMVVPVFGLLAVITLAAIWVYQRPQIEAESARQAVLTGISDLAPDLARLETLNRSLDAATIDAVEVTSVSLALDARVRGLFDAAADLSASEGVVKTRLLDATGDTADALRLFGEAYALRSGVIPILAAPHLETDPGLVTLEEAAAAFSEWQARFEAVRSALPDGPLDEVREALGALSAGLPDLQRDYLDALRLEDAPAAIEVTGRLEDGLGVIEDTLFRGLGEIGARVHGLISGVEAAFEDVASLLG